MADQFKEQGGAATMNPSRFGRWLTSKVMTRLSQTSSVKARHAKVERARSKVGTPHQVHYFHQVDDGYSHLAAQLLMPLLARYNIELHCHLVCADRKKNVPEPALLAHLSRYESQLVAPGYGLVFPDHPHEPDALNVSLATCILAAQSAETFPEIAAAVGDALWSGDGARLNHLAEAHGRISAERAEAVVRAGTQLRRQMKHYSGAMFYYGGDWYWGVDRFYLLEQRLAALGVDRHPDRDLIAPRPPIALPQQRNNKAFTLEFYASLRSPYTAVVFDRVVAFARDAGITLALRPVLPMVMRGVPATREKGMYIFMDAAREAHKAGVTYGNFYDPIGDPVRNCYALYPWAASQDKGVDLLSSFLRHAFALGVNTNTDGGLRKVVEAAGLDWVAAQAHRQDTTWEAMLEENRSAMYQAGLWGVPSFRLIDPKGQAFLAVWGQDRLWLLAQKLCDAVNQGG